MADLDVLLVAANAAARLVDDHRRACRLCARNDGRLGSGPVDSREDCPEFYRLGWEARRARWAYEQALEGP